jgi:hypothetical protein
VFPSALAFNFEILSVVRAPHWGLRNSTAPCLQIQFMIHKWNRSWAGRLRAFYEVTVVAAQHIVGIIVVTWYFGDGFDEQCASQKSKRCITRGRVFTLSTLGSRGCDIIE